VTPATQDAQLAQTVLELDEQAFWTNWVLPQTEQPLQTVSVVAPQALTIHCEALHELQGAQMRLDRAVGARA